MSVVTGTSPAALRVELARKRQVERARLLNPAGRRHVLRFAGLLVLAGALALAIFASLAFGARAVSLPTVIEALTSFNPDLTDHLVVHDLRLGRTLVGLFVGISLAVAGVLMQAITRNPLADPGLLGINSGASFFVVMAIWLLDIHAMSGLIWFAFVGAGSVAILVYLLGSMGRGGATPVRLALAGAAVHALLFALISAIIILFQESLNTYRFWVVGSLAGADASALTDLLPFFIAGLVLAVFASSALNAMALGDDTAKALGTRLTLTRVTTAGAVTLLCGCAVAAAGPVGFIGLVVPHVARAWVGADQRWLIAYSLLLGPVLLLASDVLGRVVLPPGEVQVGIMTALIGGPLFVFIVRRIRMVQI